MGDNRTTVVLRLEDENGEFTLDMTYNFGEHFDTLRKVGDLKAKAKAFRIIGHFADKWSLKRTYYEFISDANCSPNDPTLYIANMIGKGLDTNSIHKLESLTPLREYKIMYMEMYDHRRGSQIRTYLKDDAAAYEKDLVVLLPKRFTSRFRKDNDIAELLECVDALKVIGKKKFARRKNVEYCLIEFTPSERREQSRILELVNRIGRYDVGRP